MTSRKPNRSRDAVAERLTRHLVIYGAGAVLAQAVGLLTAPVLTRHLGPGGYGELEVASAAAALATVLLLAGLDVAAQRGYVQAGDGSSRRETVTTGFALVAAFALTGALSAVLAARPLAVALFDDPDRSVLVVVAALSAALAVVELYARGLFRIEERPWWYFSSAVLAAAAGGTGAVVVGVVLDGGVAGVFAGIALGTACALAVDLTGTRGLIRGRISRPEARRLLAVGLPLLPAALSVWALRLVDRFVLAGFEDLATLGRYGLASRLASVVLIAGFVVNQAWTPQALHLHRGGGEGAGHVHARALVAVAGAVAALAVAVSAFAPELVRLVAGAAYGEAAAFVPPLAFGLLLHALAPFGASALLAAGRTRTIGVHAATAAAVNLAACLVLVPLWGAVGAAWAGVAGYGYQLIAYQRSARRALRLPAVPRLAAVLALSAPWIALGWVDAASWAAAAAKAGAVGAFPLVLVAAGVVERDDVRRALGAFTRTRPS